MRGPEFLLSRQVRWRGRGGEEDALSASLMMWLEAIRRSNRRSLFADSRGRWEAVKDGRFQRGHSQLLRHLPKIHEGTGCGSYYMASSAQSGEAIIWSLFCFSSPYPILHDDADDPHRFSPSLSLFSGDNDDVYQLYYQEGYEYYYYTSENITHRNWFAW